MSGRWVRLERLEPRHLDTILRTFSAAPASEQWPLLGQAMTLEEFSEYIWHLGPLNFAVVRRDSGEPVGVVQGIDEDARSQTIGIAFVIDADLWSAGWPLEALVLFADYLFCGLGYRKLYCIVPQSVLARLKGLADRWLAVECVYRRHVRLGRDYEDVFVLALPRDQWDSQLARRMTGNARGFNGMAGEKRPHEREEHNE